MTFNVMTDDLPSFEMTDKSEHVEMVISDCRPSASETGEEVE